MTKKAICIISGGMDSAVAAKIAKDEGYGIVAIHFNYGQRTELRELEAFRAVCDSLSVLQKYEIDLPFFKSVGGSALTDTGIAVPTGGLEEGVPVTYVPFRNGIFLSIATAISEKEGAEAIVIGAVEEDGSGYPEGIKGAEIPLSGRLMAVADVYDALICKRVYKEAMEHAVAIKIIEEGAGEHFDPLVIKAFSRIEKEFLAISRRYPDG